MKSNYASMNYFLRTIKYMSAVPKHKTTALKHWLSQGV